MTRILVIDDSLTIRKLVAISLERAGFQVALASTGNEGLEQAQRVQPDLIALDFKLPDLGAEEVLIRLAQDPRTSRIPVILMSARDDDVRGSMRTSGNAIDFVSKPFNEAVIVGRVRNALANTGAAPTPASAAASSIAPAVPSRVGATSATPRPAAPSAAPRAAPSLSPSLSRAVTPASSAASLASMPSAPPAAGRGDAQGKSRAFPAWPFAQREQLARVLFQKLRPKLEQIPTWLSTTKENAAGELAKRLFTIDTIDSLIDGLEPLFQRNARPLVGTLSGSSRVLGVEQLLQVLSEQSKDGELRLYHDGLDTVLTLQNGIITLVSTTSASRYLEHVPLDLSSVPPPTIQSAAAEQARSAKPILISLHEQGVPIPQLGSLVYQRGLELLGHALVQECTYSFSPAAVITTVLPDQSRPVTVEQIKVENARREKANPGQVGADMARIFARATGFSKRVRRVTLEPAERKVAAALDGVAPLQQIAARLSLETPDASRALSVLKACGLVNEVIPAASQRTVHVVVIGEPPDFSESLRVGLSQHCVLGSYRVMSTDEASNIDASEPCDLLIVGAIPTSETEALLGQIRQKVEGAIALIRPADSSESDEHWLQGGANLVLSKPVHLPTLCGLL
ncbi:MAG: response regulator [Myxococcota bacterium]